MAYNIKEKKSTDHTGGAITATADYKLRALNAKKSKNHILFYCNLNPKIKK